YVRRVPSRDAATDEFWNVYWNPTIGAQREHIHQSGAPFVDHPGNLQSTKDRVVVIASQRPDSLQKRNEHPDLRRGKIAPGAILHFVLMGQRLPPGRGRLETGEAPFLLETPAEDPFCEIGIFSCSRGTRAARLNQIANLFKIL